jgi:hypothetical protein
MSDEPAAKKPWSGFWNFNVGHVLIIAGMAGSAWVVVNNVEIALADHASRISRLEQGARDTDARYERISEQLTEIAREVSRLQGQMMLLVPPGRRGDAAQPDDPANQGG